MTFAKLYATFYIPPTGMPDTVVKFTTEAPDPKEIARGEGSCMIFKIEGGDFSVKFIDAIQDGRFIDDFGNRWIKLDMMKGYNKK